jgi:hypothetical protein
LGELLAAGLQALDDPAQVAGARRGRRRGPRVEGGARRADRAVRPSPHLRESGRAPPRWRSRSRRWCRLRPVCTMRRRCRTDRRFSSLPVSRKTAILTTVRRVRRCGSRRGRPAAGARWGCGARAAGPAFDLPSRARDAGAPGGAHRAMFLVSAPAAARRATRNRCLS